MSVLEIRDLHVTVETEQGTKPILNGVDLTIREGEIHAIMGPNGSGKSTLAYTIAGHPKYKVTSGTITLDGEDVLAMTVDAAGACRPLPRDAVPGRDPRRDQHRTSCAPPRPRSTARRRPSAAGSRTSARSMAQAAHGHVVRRAQRQRGLLRRREEAQRDPPARAPEAQVRRARRDRLRPRRRRAQGRLRGCQPREGEHRARHHADHALHAHPALHQAGLRARVRRRPRRGGGRSRARRPPGRRRLRPLR